MITALIVSAVIVLIWTLVDSLKTPVCKGISCNQGRQKCECNCNKIP